MYEQRTGRSHWTLALALILGLGLALGLTTWASAQGVTPSSIETPSGTTITVDSEDDELTDDGDCSLREALQAANTDAAVDGCPAGDGWDTINVPAGTYTLDLTGSGDDANASGDLDVLESVTILGAGAGSTVIDGYADDRVFHVDPDGQEAVLDLRAVTVRNGSADAGGGLLAANGLTRIQDSVFRSNAATVTGGAIQADLGTLRILTSSIEYNDAGAIGKGGGIYVDQVVLSIQGSTVLSNTAQEGGGLYNNQGSATLRDTNVISNATVGSDTSGGGIFASSGNLLVEAGSEISHNRARMTAVDGGGGGIWADEASALTIMDSWIHHNESDAAGAGVYVYGYGTAYVRNSLVEHNTAAGSGGGLYLWTSLILVDSTVRHNHSDASGGGIHSNGRYAVLVISNTLVFSNTVDGNGGGAHFGEDGGGFSGQLGGVHVANSVFRENQAEGVGGGLYAKDDAGLIIEDSVFEDHRAVDGGAIFVSGSGGLSVDRSTLSGNQAAAGGGALHIGSDCSADIRNSTFSQNHAGSTGGAIHGDADLGEEEISNFGIESSTIVSNTAGTSGGGIYAGAYATAQNSIIAGNSAGGNGGAGDADCGIGVVFYSGGNNLLGSGTGCAATRYDQTLTPGTLFATVLGPLADNGGAELPGGSHPRTHSLLSGSPAIDAANDVLSPDVDERGAARPQGNACDVGAYESGYSAAVVAPVHNIIAVTTVDDVVGDDGYCSLREAITAANTDAAGNNCTTGSGWDTIVLPSGTYTLTIDIVNPDDNATGDLDVLSQTLTISGTDAATTIINADGIDRALEVKDKGALLLVGVTVTKGDTAKTILKDGGCIRCAEGHLMLLDTIVSHCTSANYGGGIYMYGSVGRLVNAVVEENRSSGQHSRTGGIHHVVGALSIRDSTVISNTAVQNGGGILSGEAVTRISNSDILSNTLTDKWAGGGGIHQEGGALILDEGTRVMHNSTPDDGGGVLAGQGAVGIKGSTVSHNHSSGAGGGIDFSSGGLWMRRSLVEHNTAWGEGGGASYVFGFIEDSTIRYNKALTNTGGGLLGWPVMLNSTLEGNKAAEGGGLDSWGAKLYNCVIEGNSVLEGDGGGIYARRPSESGGTIVVDSALRDNSGHSDQYGSAVYAYKGPLTVQGSTFSGNSGASAGGAIYGNQAVLDLLNSTLSDNGAEYGAGLYVEFGVASLNYCTLADNAASDGGGGVQNNGAAVVENSIVAGNIAQGSPSDGSADCGAAFSITFGGTSLFGDGTGCVAEGRGDLTVAPAAVWTTVIGPLADNGGPSTASGDPTWTHALLAGSPAQDAADENVCPATDQRDVRRPRGIACDMGAVERKAEALWVTVAGSGGGTVTSDPAGITCSAAGGGDCAKTYEPGTVVTLQAAAGTGSTFEGWSGACTNATGDCVVTMDAAKKVTATFMLPQALTVGLAGSGSGSVTSQPAGITCPGDCDQAYDYGTAVTLAAVAEPDSVFGGWAGACSGTAGCALTMDAVKSVTATFELSVFKVYLPTVMK